MTELVETEVKLFTPDHDLIRKKLADASAILTKPCVFERNVRYENAGGTLTSQGIVLRLREDSKIRLTYKEAGSINDGVVSRYEAEVDVSDFEIMQAILGKLRYMPYMIYEKYRTTYELRGAEIVLDEMPYGNFTEIEGSVEIIEDLIQVLDLSSAPRYGDSYTRLFENVKQHLQLSFRDLTFANFEDIVVPEHAFLPPQ